MPKTNVEFWEAKIRRNRERDSQNYQILKENGWQVLVLWECELTKKSFETTMQKVEVQLHSYYLATISHNHKVKDYIRIDEDDIPMAAEAEYDYGDC